MLDISIKTRMEMQDVYAECHYSDQAVKECTFRPSHLIEISFDFT